jgi:hypothetical protein
MAEMVIAPTWLMVLGHLLAERFNFSGQCCCDVAGLNASFHLDSKQIGGKPGKTADLAANAWCGKISAQRLGALMNHCDHKREA